MKKKIFLGGLVLVIFGALVAAVFLNSKEELSFAPVFSPLPTPTPTPLPVKIIFAGDLMFDRNIRLQAKKSGGYDFFFTNLAPLFKGADLAVANLEGPITNFSSKSVGTLPGSPNNFIFTFPPEVMETLKKNNFYLLNLGNNHILNFGLEGLAQTKNYLKAAGLNYFGNTGDDEERYFIWQKDNLKIGFVNYNQFAPSGFALAKEDVARVRPQADLVILYAHWEEEYQQQPSKIIEEQAHELVEAGVDLIIGSHPHVIQPAEFYQGKKIYYSLGNFLFDQYFSEETQKGLLVLLTLDPQTRAFSFQDLTIEMASGAPLVIKE
ncbi:CapA family protein [Candidatus Shapirobacteria bacterium]|nr:CapA family protein [Candidatus Shapirobacteria bacterium]